MSNITEGLERGGSAEFPQFLAIAKGSVGEVEAQLYVALDQKYISEEEFVSISALASSTKKLIAGFMNYLKQSKLERAEIQMTSKNHGPETLDLFPNQEPENRKQGPLTCLGMTFENDDARRAYFLDKLHERLSDPEFRKIEGFPIGSDEDILSSLPSIGSHTGEHESRQDHHEAVEISTWEYAYEN